MNKIQLSVKALLLAGGLMTTLVANANEGSVVPGVEIAQTAQKKVRVQLPSDAPVTLSIIDADGNVLYQTQAKNKAQLFNLSKLADGKYYLTADNNAWWQSQTININGNTLTLDNQTAQTLAQPRVHTYAKNKVEVSLPSKNVETVDVSIYDAHNALVMATEMKTQTERFDMSSLPDGRYHFVIGNANKHFTNTVSIAH